jgi:hypothetical protein
LHNISDVLANDIDSAFVEGYFFLFCCFVFFFHMLADSKFVSFVPFVCFVSFVCVVRFVRFVRFVSVLFVLFCSFCLFCPVRFALF